MTLFARKSPLLLCLCLLLGACGNRQNDVDADKLPEVLGAFNLLVRWNEWQQASIFVHDDTRAQWMSDRLAATRNIRIAEVTLAGVKRVPEDAPDATVFVQITWYGVNAPTVRTSLWAQSWTLVKGQGWRMKAEKPAESAPPPAEDAPGPSWP